MIAPLNRPVSVIRRSTPLNCPKASAAALGLMSTTMETFYLYMAIFGSLLAWVLTRYRFPGKELADALVDLPFALPTAVAGIALTAVYAEHGFIGRHLAANGVQVAFAPAHEQSDSDNDDEIKQQNSAIDCQPRVHDVDLR